MFWKNLHTLFYTLYIPEIYSERGERVRSKSEKIIADKLYRNGIPYKYEKPLVLKGLGKIHPDFEILNKRTRKEYFLEHLGKMDDIGYVKKNMRRINPRYHTICEKITT